MGRIVVPKKRKQEGISANIHWSIARINKWFEALLAAILSPQFLVTQASCSRFPTLRTTPTPTKKTGHLLASPQKKASGPFRCFWGPGVRGSIFGSFPWIWRWNVSCVCLRAPSLAFLVSRDRTVEDTRCWVCQYVAGMSMSVRVNLSLSLTLQLSGYLEFARGAVTSCIKGFLAPSKIVLL